MWSTREAVSKGNITLTALPRLHYFRCLLNNRGVPAAPVDNWYARRPPSGPGSCYAQWSKPFLFTVLYVMSFVCNGFLNAIFKCVLLNYSNQVCFSFFFCNKNESCEHLKLRAKHRSALTTLLITIKHRFCYNVEIWTSKTLIIVIFVCGPVLYIHNVMIMFN